MANSVKCLGVAGLECDKCVRDEVDSAFGAISD